jgi:serine/threonine protein kinase/Flp pilus assembly protein TadD
MFFMIGQIVAHYRITEKLGSGGMGVIYKAIDLRLNRPAALKFLPIHLTADAEIRQRFIQEAQAAAILNNEHIVTVYEIDEWQGQTYIAMEYIAGQTLKEMIYDVGARPLSGTSRAVPLPIKDVISITIQICTGLQAAHEAGIVHRDVKPDNVVISRRGQAKLIDFGLAKLAGQVKLTQAGSAMGTAAYMSPEQVNGEAIDLRCDIWSLGVMLYEMISGKLPFQGERMQALLRDITKREPEPLQTLRPDAPPALQDIISRCLAKNPSKRYQQVRELLADLYGLQNSYEEKTYRLPATAKHGAGKFRKYFYKTAVLLAVITLLLALPSLLRMAKSRLRHSDVPIQKYLAVLPLLVIGGDRSSQAFSDGLVETLTSKLTQVEQNESSMWIVPASELRASGINSPSQARKAMGVTLAITGSLQQNKNSIRLIMNLVDAVAMRQLRSAVITEEINASADFQDRAVDEVARMLELELKPETRSRLAAGGTAQPLANEFYLQGRGFLQRYEQQENLDKAIELFQKAIAEDSGFALAFAGLGEAFWRKYELTKDTKLVQEAKANCQQAIKLNTNLVPVYITMGIIERGSGHYPEAITNFNKALDLDQVNSEALLGLALTYQNQGKLTEAENTYKEAIKLKPNYWAAVNSLGFFYYFNGHLPEAETMFRKVIELTPDNIRGYNNLGSVYQFQGKNELAQQMFEKSLTIRANDVAYSNLGTVFFFTGRFRQAADMYEKGIAFGLNNYVIWGNLGDACRKIPEFAKKAREAYETAIRLANEQLRVNPNNANLHSSVAIYYAMIDQMMLALTATARALELGANDVTVLLNAALVYELAAKRGQALAALQKYFALSGPQQAIEQEPLFTRLRSDPGYAALLTREKAVKSKANK